MGGHKSPPTMWCGLEPDQADASGAILNGGVYGNEKKTTPENIEARWLTTLSVPKLWLIYLMGKRKRGI